MKLKHSPVSSSSDMKYALSGNTCVYIYIAESKEYIRRLTIPMGLCNSQS